MEKKEVRGYKVFNPDWTCRGFQYKVGEIFEEDVDLECCERGMHFCEKAVDCFNYYRFNPNNKVAEVIAYGEVVKEGDKSCTNKLEIVREIPWDELLTIVNMGLGCIGFKNTGDYNSGSYNTGDWNTGGCNTGDYNSGSYNTGDYNSGSYNTGDWNTGDRNTGDWNKSSFNTGCFMTEEQKIMLFNKPSYWTYRDWLESDASWLLREMPKNTVNLKKIDQTELSEYRQSWWNNLSDEKKEKIKSLPNFDADVFKECTGITVD